MGRKNYLKLATLSLAVMAVVMPAGLSAATNDDVIKEIQVQGINRVSKGAVLLALPFGHGDLMTK